MQINLYSLIRLSKIFFINYVLLVGNSIFSSEREDQPHLVLPTPHVKIQYNQVAPLPGETRYVIPSPQQEVEQRKTHAVGGVLVNSLFSVSTEVIAAHQLNCPPKSRTLSSYF